MVPTHCTVQCKGWKVIFSICMTTCNPETGDMLSQFPGRVHELNGEYAASAGKGNPAPQRPYSPLSSLTRAENAAHRVLRVFNCDNISPVSGLKVVMKIINIIFHHFHCYVPTV